MTDLFAPTLDDMIAELDRELALRARVFPRWIENGKITQEHADRRVACMKAARDVLHQFRLGPGAVPKQVDGP